MRRLHFMPLSPSSRTARIALAEKRLEFTLVPERGWDLPDTFFELNPAGTLPVLVEDDGRAIPGALLIAEYLDETYPAGESAEGPRPNLLPAGAAERVEARRLAHWFEIKFASEVSDHLVFEKIDKRFMGAGAPDMDVVRQALKALRPHLVYLNFLADERRWLAGDQFSLADTAAAAHLSALDYMGDVPWHDFEAAKLWYARVKSRPSFRPLLGDHIAGMPPPRHYADLDF
ncbi:MAG: glutathione S-transferase family protein [Alphaproteobacteria bacterium]